MRTLFVIILLQVCAMAFAGIVVKKNGETIEDVKDIVVDGQEVKFTLDGKLQSLPLSEVQAVLYDNGKYEEIKSDNTPQPIAADSELEVDNSSVESSFKKNDTRAHNLSMKTVMHWSQYYRADNKNFSANYPDEVKSHKNNLKKLRLVASLIALAKIDKGAMRAYAQAKEDGLSGDDAIRAHHDFYANAQSEENLSMPNLFKQKKKDTETIPTTPTTTSSENNW